MTIFQETLVMVPQELFVHRKHNQKVYLKIKSKKKDNPERDVNLIHQGISLRSFVRKFTLSDEIIVKNAEMKDGMLTVKLEKFIPENKKPKLISIK